MSQIDFLSPAPLFIFGKIHFRTCFQSVTECPAFSEQTKKSIEYNAL